MKFSGASAIIIILTFVTLTSAFVGYLEQKDLNLIWDCVLQHNFTHESFSVFATELEAYGKLAYDDATGHCFMKCVVEKYDLIDNDNKFKLESVENMFQREYGKLFIKERLPDALKCAKSVNQKTYENTCERAYRGVECFYAELKELSIKTDPVFKYQIECGEELELSPSELIKQLELQSTRDPKYNCFAKCLLEKLGVLEKDFNVRKYYDALGKSKEDYPSGDDLVQIEKCLNDLPNKEDEDDCERLIRKIECVSF